MAQDIRLMIGDTLCWSATGAPISQWIKCPSLSSQYLTLLNTGDAQHGISVTEIMVFEEYLITPYSALASSTLTNSDVANSMTMAQALTTADQTSCFSTTANDLTASITYSFQANFNIETMVFIGLPTPDGSQQDYSSGTTVMISQNTDGVLSLSGYCSNVGTNPEVPCSSTFGAVATLTRSSILAVCSVGFLTTDCGNCQNTKFTSSSIDPQYFYSPPSLIIDTSQGSTTNLFLPIGDLDGVSLSIYDVSTLHNSIALVCDNALLCGETVLVLCDTVTQSEIDMYNPSGFVSYSDITKTLTFQTNDPLVVGTHYFTLKARLKDYPALGYFPATTDFIVTADIYCTMQDLMSYTQGLSLLQNGVSIDAFTFWAYSDFQTPQLFETGLQNIPSCNGFGSVTYSAEVLTATGTVHLSIDALDFAGCIATNSSSCIAIDGTTLNVFIFDDIFTGLNTVSIKPTLTAFNGFKTIIYTGRVDFTLLIKNCFTTIFDPLMLTANPQNLNFANFTQYLGDPAATFDFNIADSVSQSQSDDTYCMSRYAIISPANKNGKEQSLIDCTTPTDCISISTSDNYAFTLTLEAQDKRYNSTKLQLQISVYLSQYQSISSIATAQPVSTTFITVYLESYCSSEDLGWANIVDYNFNPEYPKQLLLGTTIHKLQAYIDFVDEFKQRKLKYLYMPTCHGFDLSLTQYTPTYSLNGTASQPVPTDVANFTTCMTTLSNCFVYNKDEFAFQIYVFDESWNGLIEMMLNVTFFGHQADGSFKSNSVQVSTFARVYSCLYSSFAPEMYVAYHSFDVKNNTFFTVFQNKNMPFIQVWILDDDYLSNSPTYNSTFPWSAHCGVKNMVISPLAGDTNQALAREISDCTDPANCIYFDPNKKAFGVSNNFLINVTDPKYLEIRLEYEVVVQFQNFLDLPPTKQFTNTPITTYYFTLWVTNTYWCETPQDLLGVSFYQNDLKQPRTTRNSSYTGHITYFNEGGKNAEAIKNTYQYFSISDWPKCAGFDWSRTTYQFEAVFRNGTNMTISQQKTDYDTCKSTKDRNCFLYQLLAKTDYEVNPVNVFYVYLQDESISQDWTSPWYQEKTLNWIYEYVTVYANKQDGSEITNTYLVDKIPIYVYTCRYATFTDFVVTQPNDWNLPVFDVLIGDVKDMVVTVSDNSTSDCGPITLTLYVSPLNANPVLAQSLLNCTTACFTVKKGGGTATSLIAIFFGKPTFTFNLNMSDVAFVNQHLIYDVVTTFDYYDVPTVHGLRDDWPTKNYTLEIHPMIPNQCNISTDLAGVQFWSTPANITLTSSFFASTAYSSPFFDVFFTLKNFPTCFGFNSTLTTLSATIQKTDGTTQAFLSSTTWNNDCVRYYNQSCFAIDTTRNSLKFFIFDESATGISQVTFAATLYATDADNQLFSYVEQVTYDYNVKSCGTSVFNSPVVVSSSFSDPLNWAYNINSRTKTLTFTISDTKSIEHADSTYCGSRTITLAVASTETNPLAAQLLACAPSCLKATKDATGYILSITLAITEVKYANTVLHFTKIIKFTPYATVSQFTGQPVFTQDFQISIFHDPTCAFIEQLQGMYFVDTSATVLHGQAFSNYAYLDFTSGPQVMQLQAQDIPVCIGLQPDQFDIQITKADGTTVHKQSTLATFNSCVASKSQSCFYIDSTLLFHYYMYDTSFMGLNSITFIPTMSGYNSNNVLTVYTYTLAESTTITLEIKADCLFTTFEQPVFGSVTGMPDIKTNLLNPLPPTTFDIGDSVSTANAISGYCGGRIYKIISTDSNSLSLNLLSCATNCLKLSSSGNTVTISLKVNDRAYLGLSLPFTLQVILIMYNSIPQAPNPISNFNFNVITYAHDSCMSTIFNSPKSYNTTTNVASLLNFRAQVKAYKQVTTKDAFHDANFPFTRYYVQTTDSVSVQKAVPTFCNGRNFQLTVASNETSNLANQLLTNQSLSQIYFAPYDDYTFFIAVRILEDVYTGHALSFNLTIWLNQYHSNSTIGEPSSSYNLLLMIDPCTIFSSIQSPLSAQSFQYYINTTMSPLQFTIKQIPNCVNPAKYSLHVGTLSDLTSIKSTYGVYMTESSNDGYDVNLMMWIFTSSYSLLNSHIEVQLTNLDRSMPLSFGNVSLSYLCQVQSAVLTPSTASNYFYQIGSVMGSLSYYVARNSACQNLGEIEVTVSIDNEVYSNYEDYGIVVSQTQSGSITQINLASYYNSTLLNGKPLELTLSYKVDGLELTFQTITAVYVTSLLQAKSTDPPYFTTQLAVAEDIPCLNEGSKWLYRFPPTRDPNGYPVKSSFYCPNLQKSMKFDGTLNVLSLNTKGVLPAPGGQDCKITLSNPTGAFQSYNLNLFVICDIMANGTLWNWTTVVRKPKAKPPLPTMQASSRYGDLYIYWNQPMTMTNLSGNYSNQIQTAVTRQLQDQVLDLKYSQESDPTRIRTQNLNYTYDIFWANDRTTQIAIKYQNPQYVSAQTQVKDKIIVSFVNPKFFMSKDGNYMSDNITLETTVPKQIAPGSVDLGLDETQGKTVAQVILISVFILSLLMTYVMNKLLSLVVNIVLILHYFILTLDYPANVQDFFAFLFPLVIFDALPVEGLYQDIFDFINIEDAPINDNFDAVGYGNTIIVENMGSLWLITVITISYTLIVTLIRCLPWKSVVCCCKKRLEAKINNYVSEVYWNGVISFIDACYLCLLMMAIIGLTDLRLDSSYTLTERYNSLLGIAVFGILIAFPFVMALIYMVKLKSAIILPDPQDDMQIETIRYLYKTTDFAWIHQNVYTKSQHDKFMSTYGVLLQDIDIARLGKSQAIFASLVPTFHKLLLATTIMTTVQYPVIAICAFNIISLFVLIYIYHMNPFTSYHIKRRAILNQYVLLIVNYHLYFMTEWLNIDEQIIVGDSIIRFVIIQCAILTTIELFEILKQLKRSCLRFAYRRRQRLKQKHRKSKTVHIQVTPNLNNGETTQQKIDDLKSIFKSRRHIGAHSESNLLHNQTSFEVSSLNGVNWQANFIEMIGHVDEQLQDIPSEANLQHSQNPVATYYPESQVTVVDLVSVPDVKFADQTLQQQQSNLPSPDSSPIPQKMQRSDLSLFELKDIQIVQVQSQVDVLEDL